MWAKLSTSIHNFGGFLLPPLDLSRYKRRNQKRSSRMRGSSSLGMLANQSYAVRGAAGRHGTSASQLLQQQHVQQPHQLQQQERHEHDTAADGSHSSSLRHGNATALMHYHDARAASAMPNGVVYRNHTASNGVDARDFAHSRQCASTDDMHMHRTSTGVSADMQLQCGQQSTGHALSANQRDSSIEPVDGGGAAGRGHGDDDYGYGKAAAAAPLRRVPPTCSTYQLRAGLPSINDMHNANVACTVKRCENGSASLIQQQIMQHNRAVNGQQQQRVSCSHNNGNYDNVDDWINCNGTVIQPTAVPHVDTVEHDDDDDEYRDEADMGHGEAALPAAGMTRSWHAEFSSRITPPCDEPQASSSGTASQQHNQSSSSEQHNAPQQSQPRQRQHKKHQSRRMTESVSAAAIKTWHFGSNLKKRITHRIGRSATAQLVTSTSTQAADSTSTKKQHSQHNISAHAVEKHAEHNDELSNERLITNHNNNNVKQLVSSGAARPRPRSAHYVQCYSTSANAANNNNAEAEEGENVSAVGDERRRRTVEHSASGAQMPATCAIGHRSQLLAPAARALLYEKVDKLGEGSYATVYKCRDQRDGRIVALKEIKLQPEEGLPFTAIREASLLKGLKHSNIVLLHDIIHERHTLIFIFEYMKSDLSRYLESRPDGIQPHNAKLFTFQLLRGLAFCHERKILHRDLKPQNLLINDTSGELKLADFGLARAKSVPSRTYSHEVVTLWYRPPDVLLGSRSYSTSLDMWGVGCILAEMLTGRALFPGANTVADQLDCIFAVLGRPGEQQWARLAPNKPHYHRDDFSHYARLSWHDVGIPQLHGARRSGNTNALLDALLKLDPAERCSAKEAMREPCFDYVLPPSVHRLPPGSSIFILPEVHLETEFESALQTDC